MPGNPDSFKAKDKAQRADTKTTKLMQKQLDKVNKVLSQQAKLMAKTTAAHQKHTAKLNKQLKATKAQLKIDKLFSKGMRTQISLLKRQTKEAERTAKSYRKLHKQMAKKMPKPSRGGGGGGGMGLAMPGFISVAAITASATALAGYTMQLARTRDVAQALGGAFRDVNDHLPARRDAELFSRFAQQSFASRFSGQTEIEGLQDIRDSLSKALGESYGTDLTVKLTESFKGSSDELQRFLAMASRDVPQALKVFQSRDIETFSTALAGVTMKTDGLTNVAFSLEQGWRDIQDSFESFVTEFVTANETDLKTVVQDIASGIVDLINAGRRWASEMKPVFDFIIGSFRVVADAVDFWKDPFSGGRKAGILKSATAEMEIYNQAAQKYIELAKAAKARGQDGVSDQLLAQAQQASDRANEVYAKALETVNGPSFEPLTLKTAQHVDDLATNMTDAVNQSQKERDELEGMATDAQKVALKIQRINERLEETDLGIRVARSAVQAAESSPFGFARAFKTRMKLANAITDKINDLRQQWELIDGLENKTKADRMKALEIEEKINQQIAERNQLLKQQQRGYLDAVLAQVANAGAFEKTIVDQNRNLGMALEKGLVKANPLLGQVGEDANKYDVHPFRFSTDMEANATGLQKYAEELAKNIGAKPSAGEESIVARIDETNRLLKHAVLPAPREMTDALQASGQSTLIPTRLEQASPKGRPLTSRSEPNITLGNARKGSELMKVVAKATQRLVPIMEGIEELEVDVDSGVTSRHPGIAGGNILNSG